MIKFQTSLLREKFVIKDSKAKDAAPVIALSNRLVVPLISADGTTTETLVVRAQNMHTCLRYAAHMANEFLDSGPLIERPTPFDWRYAYLAITKGYEKKWNPNRWVVVYHKGQPVYQDGETKHHPFLDIIEQCDARNQDDYEQSVHVAERAFQKAGKKVDIEHDASVASIINMNGEEAKCGVILRNPHKTTTFSFTATEKAGRRVKPSQCMSVSAAFLEGVQLAFFVGMTNIKIKLEMVTKSSEEGLKSRDSSQKIARLNGAVTQFENFANVQYRPDKPNFSKIIDEAEAYAKNMFAEQIKQRIAAGEETEWI